MQEDIAILMNSIAMRSCESSYKKLFSMLFFPLTRFAYCILKSRQQAEEVASDVLLMLWQRRHSLAGVKNIKSYAFISANNISLNLLKKKQPECVSLDDVDLDVRINIHTPEDILINAELKKRLEQSINTLPAKGKLVFKLVKEDGFSYKEVAEIMNISVKTVDAHLTSSIKKLCLILKEEFNLA